MLYFSKSKDLHFWETDRRLESILKQSGEDAKVNTQTLDCVKAWIKRSEFSPDDMFVPSHEFKQISFRGKMPLVKFICDIMFILQKLEDTFYSNQRSYAQARHYAISGSMESIIFGRTKIQVFVNDLRQTDLSEINDYINKK